MAVNFPPSLKFTHPNTPIYPLKRFAEPFTGKNIWIKRDDYTGIELSGNKVRKLDYLLSEAMWNKASHIITCGGIQSNHCRATAFMAVKAGLKCTLFLRGQPDELPTGNLLLNFLSGVHIIYVTSEEYQEIDRRMADYAKSLTQLKEIPYVIPEGGSNATGAWGYISCFQEISNQIKKENLQLDAIIVATGSGGTHAGLLFGKKILSSEIAIVSINVCDDADFFYNKIMRIADDFEQKYKFRLHLKPDDIKIIEGYAGEGYGLINESVKKTIIDFARQEGIILDPVYSAKAFLGLKSLLQEKKIEYNNILFIHTGGIFGIFPFARDLDFKF